MYQSLDTGSHTGIYYVLSSGDVYCFNPLIIPAYDGYMCRQVKNDINTCEGLSQRLFI